MPECEPFPFDQMKRIVSIKKYTSLLALVMLPAFACTAIVYSDAEPMPEETKAAAQAALDAMIATPNTVELKNIGFK